MTDFTKGQQVTFSEYTRGVRAAGYGPDRPFLVGDTAEVTTVRRLTITVRHELSGYSYNVPRSSLAAPNGEQWEPTAKPAKTPTRKLGTPPEGAISPDDPRIAWLWEDAEKLANRRGYCGVYDEITNSLNIPGRMRDIRVSFKHAGIEISATVKARSEDEAKQKIKASLAKSTETV